MEISEQAKAKMLKKKKNQKPESQFRHRLDTCSKKGDLAGALALYESADAEGIHLSSYHFGTLLHIVSASIDALEGEAKLSAVDAGFRIFDRMVAAGAAPTEATVTSMARIATQRLDGTGADFAFGMVRDLQEKYGVSPRLRTYGPALFAFCRRHDAERAYLVEKHMISMGIAPEEQEIAALLEVSSKEQRGEKVYEYLQKLRSSVRCVATSTADILEDWFRSATAGEVGSLNWDLGQAKNAILINGGGWHGLGWLGMGQWEVARVNVSSKGHCSFCRQRLACVDIDRMETEKFAESVASLALKREVKLNFNKFQEWLENHAEYEAIVDGANIGFYQQNFAEGGFSLSQLDTVVQELYERSRNKWPLIILHNKRINGLMENPSHKQLLETWRENGALYTTPNGSNDDWYWLYAAIKLKCLLVTNDEMRDHIFEILGRNFFLKWKEGHQVRYTFVKGELKIVMPPPYSSVIQESETGSWHVPLDEKCSDERERIWLCMTKPSSRTRLNEADLEAQSIETSVDLIKTSVILAENVNGVQKVTTSQTSVILAENVNGVQKVTTSQPSDANVLPVNRKRKDRSSSPSNPLNG